MASYNTVKETVINYVQMNYKNGQDVTKSLKQMEKVDLTSVEPKISTSTKSNAEKKHWNKQVSTSSTKKNYEDIWTGRIHWMKD